MTNRDWLLENADIPIRYYLTHDESLTDKLLGHVEVSAWLSRLSERSESENIGDIHGSHDYRMENILGKCWILGLSKNNPPFAEKMEFILRYLNQHTQLTTSDEPSFGRIYHYRDHEKVLACFLPLLGYHDHPAVLHIVRKRIDVLYEFTKQKRYDIYVDGSKLKGAKREWQPYIINPDLYSDGHITLPDMHDYLLLAGMLPNLSDAEKAKAEMIAAWLFEEGYSHIIRRYGYFYIPGGSYNTKAVIFKLHLLDFTDMSFDKGDLVSLLFNMFVLSHFKAARESSWFSLVLQYLEQYKTENGRYKFPSHLIMEKPDSYVIFGGHMNVGEDKKNKRYSEILSTYWMERILSDHEGIRL